MKVGDAIKLLRESELKQLGLKENKHIILGYINMGVLELHKRFPLWQDEATITMIAGVTLYKLDGVDSNVTIDLDDHDLIMIEEAYDPDGKQIRINDKEDTDGFTTPRYHTIEALNPIITGDVSIVYRATPKFLTYEKADIQLPPQFLEALFHYVGYRGHASLQGDIKSENNTHYMRFEKSCNRIKLEGLIASESLHSHKFYDRGFV